jgi:hypothetical protein
MSDGGGGRWRCTYESNGVVIRREIGQHSVSHLNRRRSECRVSSCTPPASPPTTTYRRHTTDVFENQMSGFDAAQIRPNHRYRKRPHPNAVVLIMHCNSAPSTFGLSSTQRMLSVGRRLCLGLRVRCSAHTLRPAATAQRPTFDGAQTQHCTAKQSVGNAFALELSLCLQTQRTTQAEQATVTNTQSPLTNQAVKIRGNGDGCTFEWVEHR